MPELASRTASLVARKLSPNTTAAAVVALALVLLLQRITLKVQKNGQTQRADTNSMCASCYVLLLCGGRHMRVRACLCVIRRSAQGHVSLRCKKNSTQSALVSTAAPELLHAFAVAALIMAIAFVRM